MVQGNPASLHQVGRVLLLGLNAEAELAQVESRPDLPERRKDAPCLIKSNRLLAHVAAA